MFSDELNKKYDYVLVNLCELVIKRQKEMPNFFGMVGAAVISNDKIVLNTSSKIDGKWMHAERNAINAYELKYGNLDNAAVIVTTLSPCCNSMTDRHGDSCTDFISKKGIKTVYCGYKDPTQISKHNSFESVITENTQIKELCKLFAKTFLWKYKK